MQKQNDCKPLERTRLMGAERDQDACKSFVVARSSLISSQKLTKCEFMATSDVTRGSDVVGYVGSCFARFRLAFRDVTCGRGLLLLIQDFRSGWHPLRVTALQRR